jgi:hypothetical protein
MLDRRIFLKLTGYLAASSALIGLPVATRESAAGEAPVIATQSLRAAGTYQISGRVRLQEQRVEISGISNTQQISRSPGSLTSSLASFTSFEHFDQPWQMPEIHVRGGQLEALTVLPLDFGVG